MSDDLEGLFSSPPGKARKPVAGPLRSYSLRVRGGPSLDGGPHIPLDIPSESSPDMNRPNRTYHADPTDTADLDDGLLNRPGVNHAAVDRAAADRAAADWRSVAAASADRSGPGYVGGPPVGERVPPAVDRYTPPPSRAVSSAASAGGAVRAFSGASTRASYAAGVDRFKPSADAQLAAVGLKKSFTKGHAEIPVLRGVNLAVRRGEFLTIVGQSGSGKSTLLHLLATLDSPDAGEIHFDGRRIDNLAGRARDQIRNQRIGMIFQFYHLLPELTALENALAPIMIRHGVLGYLARRRQCRRRALKLLELVGLGHRVKHRPKEMSGGEMQRAAIARALMCEPELLLADEPTGNLDQNTGRDILDILHALNRRQNLTIVMVTHDPAIAQQADRVVRMVDGRLDAQLA